MTIKNPLKSISISNLNKSLFLQSESQKKLYEKLGQKTWFFEAGAVKSLVTKVEAKRGTYLFLPYGPLTGESSDLGIFFRELCLRAKAEKAVCIRISPFFEDDLLTREMLRSLGFRASPLHQLAESLWILPLEGKKEQDVLLSMEKKHRNLIRRAAKDGVTVSFSTDDAAAERFIVLHHQTVGRHQFTPYPKSYFKHQVQFFRDQGEVLVAEAFYQGHLLASAIIMMSGKVSAYHHGASSSDPQFRKIPASYLLQWEVVRESLRRGMSHYNFWGIAPEGLPHHPFSGITHFKTGFGGQRLELVPCHDLIIDKKRYAALWLVERFRKWRRGF